MLMDIVHQQYVKDKTVLPAPIRPKTLGYQTRLAESSPPRLSNASFLVVVTGGDTPQCSYCFPEKKIVAAVNLTVATVRSQITAIDIPLRLVLHVANLVEIRS